MDIVLYSLLLLGGVAFIAYPLFAGRQQRLSQKSRKVERREALLQEKQAVYAAIKDLDFEYKTGKLSDEDYTALRESYRARALNLLKQIDEPEQASTSAAAPADEVADAESHPKQQKDTSILTDASVSTKTEALYCVQCGQSNPQGSKFCSECGTPLETAPTCGKCGTVQHSGDRFCRICGNPYNA
jgi:RNA polymerase subunit RPABC4/transcription elongation factor Spt4